MVENKNKRKHQKIAKPAIVNKKNNTKTTNKKAPTKTSSDSTKKEDGYDWSKFFSSKEESDRYWEKMQKVLDEQSSDDYFDSDDTGTEYSDEYDDEDDGYYDSDARKEREEFERRQEAYIKEMLAEEGIESDSDDTDSTVRNVVQPKKKKQKVETKSATSSSSQSSSSKAGVYYNVKFDLPRHKFNRVMCLAVQGATLSHLHKLLMYAFDWDDGHLHMFHTYKGNFTDRSMCEDGKEESKCRLDSVLNESVDSIDYVYDFASEWNISISLEKILTEKEMKEQAKRFNINLPNDLKRVAFCCGGLGGSIDEESGKKKGKFDINKENEIKINFWN